MGTLALIAAPPATESDREFFLDRHSRRALRFRRSLADEPGGMAVLVHRDGRKWCWPVESDAAFNLNSDPLVLEILFNAVVHRSVLEMETAAVV